MRAHFVFHIPRFSLSLLVEANSSTFPVRTRFDACYLIPFTSSLSLHCPFPLLPLSRFILTQSKGLEVPIDSFADLRLLYAFSSIHRGLQFLPDLGRETPSSLITCFS